MDYQNHKNENRDIKSGGNYNEIIQGDYNYISNAQDSSNTYSRIIIVILTISNIAFIGCIVYLLSANNFQNRFNQQDKDEIISLSESQFNKTLEIVNDIEKTLDEIKSKQSNNIRSTKEDEKGNYFYSNQLTHSFTIINQESNDNLINKSKTCNYTKLQKLKNNLNISYSRYTNAIRTDYKAVVKSEKLTLNDIQLELIKLDILCDLQLLAIDPSLNIDHDLVEGVFESKIEKIERYLFSLSDSFYSKINYLYLFFKFPSDH